MHVHNNENRERKKKQYWKINLVNHFRKCHTHLAISLQPKNWFVALFSLGWNLYDEEWLLLLWIDFPATITFTVLIILTFSCLPV